MATLPSASVAECAADNIPYFFALAKKDAQPHGVFLGQISQLQLVSEKSAKTKEGWPATYYDYVAQFSGLRGNRQGFTEKASGKVQIQAIEVEGLSIPFSLPPVGEDAVFFFDLVDEGWLIRAGGCGGLWAKTRTPEIITDAILCLANDGAC